MAEVVLTVPSATAQRGAGEAGSIQPLASLFDQVTFVVLDVICLDLAQRRGVDDAALRERHSNID